MRSMNEYISLSIDNVLSNSDIICILLFREDNFFWADDYL